MKRAIDYGRTEGHAQIIDKLRSWTKDRHHSSYNDTTQKNSFSSKSTNTNQFLVFKLFVNSFFYFLHLQAATPLEVSRGT